MKLTKGEARIIIRMLCGYQRYLGYDISSHRLPHLKLKASEQPDEVRAMLTLFREVEVAKTWLRTRITPGGKS